MFERFIARQAILKDNLTLFGYDPRFRAEESGVGELSRSSAPYLVDASTMLFHWEPLTGNAPAFVSLGRTGTIERRRLLSPGKVVLEILETFEPAQEVLEACRALAVDRYVIALDDFKDEPKWQPLIPYVRFLEVDFRAANHELRKSIAKRYLPSGIAMLAEKVETECELQEARNLGYTYFQGYFFCKPAMVSGKDIPAGRSTCLRLLEECSAPDLDYDVIEAIFSQEPSLTYRLLRFLNSPLLPFRAEIHSVRHAITLLGEREFRRWVAIVALVMIAGGKPAELIRTALTRAYFCEELARPLGLSRNSSDLFLMGLLRMRCWTAQCHKSWLSYRCPPKFALH